MAETFEFRLPTLVRFEQGLAGKLADEVRALAGDDASKVVVVSDPGVVVAGLTDKAVGPLRAAGFQVRIYKDIQSDPSGASVNAAAALIRDFNPDCVIGLGGGSAMDVAKLAEAISHATEDAEAYALCATGFPPGRIPTIMVPTTSGTASEVTRTSIFTNSKGSKVWAWGDRLAADLAVLDPEMTLTLPLLMTASTAFDAMSHAVESVTTRGSNEFTMANGLRAIKLIATWLPRVMERPDDVEGRGKLAIASLLAGIAFGQSGTGIPHGMGHAIGSLGHIHHGRAVILVLRAIFAWEAEVDPPKHIEIAQALGVTDLNRDPVDIVADGAAALDRLITGCDLEVSLHGDGMGLEDVDRLVEATLSEENKPICDNNCRLASLEEMRDIATKILAA